MTIFIESYNPKWKIEFENIKQIIETKLAEFNIEVQHVGSTSIEGLCAKPILDIDIIIEKKNLLIEISSRLVNMGYQPKGEQGIPGRFAFRQTSDFAPLTTENNKWTPHHLYVCYSDSLALKNHILFRDTLSKDKDLLEKYSKLKKSLSNNPNITREAYTKMKTDFIISVLAMVGLDENELESITKVNS